jgi:hypothetical protein
MKQKHNSIFLVVATLALSTTSYADGVITIGEVLLESTPDNFSRKILWRSCGDIDADSAGAGVLGANFSARASWCAAMRRRRARC